MKRVICAFIILGVAALGGGILIGLALEKDTVRLYPYYIMPTIIKEKPVERVRVEAQEVVKEVYLGSGELREFNSVNELCLWLRDNKVNENKYVRGTYECEEFALDLHLDAYADGYRVGLVDNGEHLKNFTVIDNRVYWVEPQTDQINRYGQLD